MHPHPLGLLFSEATTNSGNRRLADLVDDNVTLIGSDGGKQYHTKWNCGALRHASNVTARPVHLTVISPTRICARCGSFYSMKNFIHAWRNTPTLDTTSPLLLGTIITAGPSAKGYENPRLSMLRKILSLSCVGSALYRQDPPRQAYKRFLSVLPASLLDWVGYHLAVSDSRFEQLGPVALSDTPATFETATSLWDPHQLYGENEFSDFATALDAARRI